MDFAAALTAFGLIFVAELPDKTAYTMLLLAARGRPLLVFLGSALAFAVQGLIAVALGSFAQRFSPELIRYAAAAVFFFAGVYLLLTRGEEAEAGPRSSKRVFLSSFGLVFLAELGDATQLGTAALVARLRNAWSVYLGATLALWAVAVLAVTLGGTLGPRLPKKTLRKAGGALFLVFAVLSLALAR